MTTSLPWIAVGLFVLFVVLPGGGERAKERFSFGSLAGIAFLLAASLALVFATGPDSAPQSLGVGLAAGLVFSALLSVVEGFRGAGHSGAAIAAATTGITLLAYGEPLDPVQRWLGLALGLGLGSLALAVSGARTKLAGDAAFAGAALAFVAIMTFYRTEVPLAALPAWIGVSGAAAALISALAKRPGANSIGALVFVLAAFLAARVQVQAESVSEIALAAGLTGLVVAWMVPAKGEASAFTMMLAGIAWVALATAAFAHERGLGVAVASAVGVGTLLIAGNPRAIVTLAPLLAIGMYRAFYQLSPGASRVLDIGQHYAIIGVLLGALLSLAPLEWWLGARNSASRKPIVAAMLAIVFLIGAVAGMAILGASGTVGMLVGLGLGPLFAALKPEGARGSLLASVSLGALIAATFSQAQLLTELTREDKVRWLAVGSVVCLLLVIAALRLSTPAKGEVAA